MIGGHRVVVALVLRHTDDFAAGEGGDAGDSESRGGTIARVLEEACAYATRKGAVLCVAILVKDIADVVTTLRSWCTHEIEMRAPSTDCRLELLQELAPANLKCGHALSKLADRTAALTPRDLNALMGDAATLALHRALAIDDESARGGDSDCGDASPSTVTAADLDTALDRQSALKAASAIGGAAPTIPDIKWDDVGGLEDVKAALLDTIELPLKCPHLFAAGVRRRSGVLLYGPPGTGKTLLAKAVASQCQLNFLSVKGPELINSYVGESERNVRDLFGRARAVSNCVW